MSSLKATSSMCVLQKVQSTISSLQALFRKVSKMLRSSDVIIVGCRTNAMCGWQIFDPLSVRKFIKRVCVLNRTFTKRFLHRLKASTETDRERERERELRSVNPKELNIKRRFFDRAGQLVAKFPILPVLAIETVQPCVFSYGYLYLWTLLVFIPPPHRSGALCIDGHRLYVCLSLSRQKFGT